MLKEKYHKKFRNCYYNPNSATIRKEIMPENSSEHLVWNRRGTGFEDWEKRTSNSPTLHRPDPFGIQSCFLDYSMNKKYRWKIREEMGERIEDVQDPFNHLRVSSSVHTVDNSHNLLIDVFDGNPKVDQPCNALYDVSRDGLKVTKRFSKTGKSVMRDLLEAPSEKERDQPKPHGKALHIHYFAWEVADSPSMFNKRANGQRKDRSWNGISALHPKCLNRRIDCDLYVN
ncbi:hypothetical protein PMAYCL1PPCAC_00877 [Pristionchus mayeri]|uniref:Uncharacterized protein n=1 Tax=Pristionchus mayeri TaxID=1317129 RepID=A0AAN4YX93_9BILA|nr:hypothetical protein PMAYCL1PPCAC_00877 [Pristionchus mayeri]